MAPFPALYFPQDVRYGGLDWMPGKRERTSSGGCILPVPAPPSSSSHETRAGARPVKLSGTERNLACDAAICDSSGYAALPFQFSLVVLFGVANACCVASQELQSFLRKSSMKDRNIFLARSPSAGLIFRFARSRNLASFGPCLILSSERRRRNESHLYRPFYPKATAAAAS